MAAVVALTPGSRLTTAACAALEVSRASVHLRRTALTAPPRAPKPRPPVARALPESERGQVIAHLRTQRFGAATEAAVTRCFTGDDVTPVGDLRIAVEPRWRAVPPDALYAEGMHLAQRAYLLRDQIIAECPDAADGVSIVGTGVRCVGIIADLEAALGRPVVTANQASLWRCLRLVGVEAALNGYGRLFSLPTQAP